MQFFNHQITVVDPYQITVVLRNESNALGNPASDESKLLIGNGRRRFLSDALLGDGYDRMGNGV